MPETRKLLGSAGNKITKDKSGKNVPKYCNIVINNYQQDKRVLHTFVPNKPFGSLLEISPKHSIFLKTFDSEFQDIRVWFTDQISQPLEIEDRINLTLEIK